MLEISLADPNYCALPHKDSELEGGVDLEIRP
jgi:hypothetical protein